MLKNKDKILKEDYAQLRKGNNNLFALANSIKSYNILLNKVFNRGQNSALRLRNRPTEIPTLAIEIIVVYSRFIKNIFNKA